MLSWPAVILSYREGGRWTILVGMELEEGRKGGLSCTVQYCHQRAELGWSKNGGGREERGKRRKRENIRDAHRRKPLF